MAVTELVEQLSTGQTPAHWGAPFTKTVHKQPKANTDPAKSTLPAGYVVLITGAGKGIGEHIAKAYALAKAAGIIITARTASDLQRVKADLEAIAAGQGHKLTVTACPGDATDPNSYQGLAEVVDKTYAGRLDCLVCNAGGGDFALNAKVSKIHETDVAEYIQNTTLNYLSAYFAAKFLVPLLLRPQNVGRTLINITSLSSHMVDEMPFMSYNIAKLALNRMTETIAANYSADGLTAVSLHPGGVATPGTGRLLGDMPADLANSMKTAFTDDIGLCGAVCVWIARERPGWLSGRYMAVDWDLDELTAMKDEIVRGDKLKFRMVV